MRDSDERLRIATDNARVGLVMVDRERRYTFVNATYAQILALPSPDIVGQRIADVLAPLYEQQIRPRLDRAFAGERIAYDLHRLTPDGTRHYAVRYEPTEVDGLVSLVVVVLTDITDLKNAEMSARMLAAIVESSDDAIIGKTLDGTITSWNTGAEKVFGYSRAEMVGQSMLMLFPPDRYAEEPRIIAQIACGESVEHFETVRVRKDGERIHVSATISPIRDDTGRIVGASKIARDITGRKLAETKIRRLNRVYAVLSQINMLIVRVRNRDELFREACRIAVETGGFYMAFVGVVDREANRIVPVATAGDDEALMDFIGQVLSSVEKAPKTLIARSVREKAAAFSNHAQSDPRVVLASRYAQSGVLSMAALPLVVADDAVGVLVLYSGETGFFHEEEMQLLNELAGDVAFAIDHIEKSEQLDYLASYDALTGLANRSLFLERLAQHLRSAASDGHRLAVFLLDLERFKNINDNLGQLAGDDLLKQVAKWLERNAGDAILLARVGADQYAVVLPEVAADSDVASYVQAMMSALLEQPFRLNDAVFRIAAKAGIAVFPNDGDDADALYKHAEAALKQAKSHGDRYLFYTRAMTEQVAHKPNLESQLRQALDNEEFVLHYQPKVDLASNVVVGAEALIRWNDPRSGLVPPFKFIPILEETGLIQEVGRWALRKAIEDYMRWLGLGLRAPRIAVNVSPLQLRNRGFINEVEQAVAVDAYAPAGLELEITESMVMEDIKQSVASLHSIRALGVGIAIDDFGTGFSSLGYLAKLPVDILKIDRSFIIDMTEGPQGLSLVSTIINLAHSLNLKVVAEGVETEEQKRLLRLLRCDQMQGYLFSKPVPADVFEEKFMAKQA